MAGQEASITRVLSGRRRHQRHVRPSLLTLLVACAIIRPVAGNFLCAAAASAARSSRIPNVLGHKRPRLRCARGRTVQRPYLALAAERPSDFMFLMAPIPATMVAALVWNVKHRKHGYSWASGPILPEEKFRWGRGEDPGASCPPPGVRAPLGMGSQYRPHDGHLPRRVCRAHASERPTVPGRGNGVRGPRRMDGGPIAHRGEDARVTGARTPKETILKKRTIVLLVAALAIAATPFMFVSSFSRPRHQRRRLPPRPTPSPNPPAGEASSVELASVAADLDRRQ